MENHLKSSAFFDEAFTALRQKRYEEAISFFQQVLALNPSHVQSYGNMALAHSVIGQQKIALQYLDKAVLLDPTYEPAKQNRKIISQIKEGERRTFQIRETLYYKEKLESKGRNIKSISKIELVFK